ncbi:hypothetical protein, conserved [Entamoeba dispar SAW760]|uniref:Uncharacterized protein n=1 Tax=Entamoeba dispar (strain ATCC PRA-260 / SAW760) TaxID=370354 RepID=B0E6F3_ENTDS|nr:uncharacterized protein EDI_008090 [Entamoeba dispar SAW760]EDR29888.1 hypothetical protein, conserved [Entamoeba dispar SAW760]|eukprot:EDR29888.1 hypothetical protein, conserved [Entamoeba dispar SAW760]
MKQLDMVYLMKVALHVEDMNDVQNIEMINKKCGIAINSLKINPWFTSEKDVNKFCRIFNPPTCNCNLLNVDESVLMKVEKIRNYDLQHFFKTSNGKQPKQSMESMTCFSYASEEVIGIIIQNMKKGIKIRCNELIAKKFDTIFDKMKINESFYPSEMIVVGSTNGKCIKNVEKKNVLMICYCQLTDEILMDIPKSIRVYSTRVFIPETNNESNVKHIRSSHELLFSNIKPIYQQPFKGTVDVKININDINNEENRKKVHQIINDLYANSLTIYDNRNGLFGQCNELIVFETSQLPESIKYISFSLSDSKLIMSNKHIECVEMHGQRSSLELQSINNLKQLIIDGVNEIKINEKNKEQGITTTNKRRYWKEIQENIYTFQNLELLRLDYCSNLNISLISNKLKSIEIINCRECKINIKSDCIERLKLERNKQTQIKLSTNKSNNICIRECENFKFEIESNNEQNIEILEGNQINVKSKCPINKLIVSQSKQVNITGNERCNTMKVIESTINEIDVKPKRIIFKSIEEYIKVPLKEAEEIYIVSMKDYIFEELFDKCKKLCIDECENCQFIINKNQIKEMKITKCKNTEITGKLDNIEEIITIDNEECNIPETKNVIKEDTEIIEMDNTNKDIEIETDKKYVIIRNIHDRNIKIRSNINSDVTIENCKKFRFEGEYEEYGNIKLINCMGNDTPFIGEETTTRIGCAESVMINKFENNYFKIGKIKKSLEVIDSQVGIGVSSIDDNNIIDKVHIENTKLYGTVSIVPCNKVCIINSTETYSIIRQCKEELVLKRMNDIRTKLSESLKKLEMEECDLIDIDNDMKRKEVKMVRCHDIKIVDTSNSINQIDCDNVEVITEQQNEMMGGFGMMRGFIPNNMPMGGFGGGLNR